MAKVCEICGKKPGSGHNVSHSGRKTKRRWLPNLQRVKASIGGRTQHLFVCTRCLRSNKVTKAL